MGKPPLGIHGKMGIVLIIEEVERMEFLKCDTCLYCIIDVDADPCGKCDKSSSGWQPSELYTAYLAEKERADKYKVALNCACLGVDGEPCPYCAEIRKEARG
jgi:hypothetical protein